MTINTEPDVHHLVICANLFIRSGDKYLLLKRSEKKRFAAGFLHPVGGKVELDEDPFVAAGREAFEEAGVKVKNMRLEAVPKEVLTPPDFDPTCVILHFR